LAAIFGRAKKRPLLVAFLFSILSGLGFVILGLTMTVIMSALFYFVKMFSNIVYRSHAETIWQTAVPEDRQGRVFGFKTFVNQITVLARMALMPSING
jgi:uncharacterized RDD family membrane protein YckC